MKNSKDKDMYILRESVIEDINEIVKMKLELQQCIEESNSNLWIMSEKLIEQQADEYKKHIYDKNSLLISVISMETNTLVGMGLGKVCHHNIYIPGMSGRIDDIWVDPIHRKKGICSEIIKRLINFFEENHIKVLALDYVKGNIGSEIVWNKIGFKPILITAVANINDVASKVSNM